MQSISQFGRRHGLSRSTLLYYDRLGLLRPSYRTAAGYRLYSSDDEVRLKKICHYRKAELSLAAIAELMEDERDSRRAVSDALHRRLSELNREIAALRRQQQVVLELLPRRKKGADRLARAMTKEKWIALLRSVGMSEPDMRDWHVAFERQSPLAHQDFLESLGLDDAEISRIRTRSATLSESPAPANVLDRRSRR